MLGLLFERIYEFYKEGGRESERFLCDFVLVVLFCEGLGWRKLLEKTLDTERRKFGVAYEFTRRNIYHLNTIHAQWSLYKTVCVIKVAQKEAQKEA